MTTVSLTDHFQVLWNHRSRIRAEENIEVKDSTDGAPGEGWSRLEDHVWEKKKNEKLVKYSKSLINKKLKQ